MADTWQTKRILSSQKSWKSFVQLHNVLTDGRSWQLYTKLITICEKRNWKQKAKKGKNCPKSSAKALVTSFYYNVRKLCFASFGAVPLHQNPTSYPGTSGINWKWWNARHWLRSHGLLFARVFSRCNFKYLEDPSCEIVESQSPLVSILSAKHIALIRILTSAFRSYLRHSALISPLLPSVPYILMYTFASVPAACFIEVPTTTVYPRGNNIHILERWGRNIKHDCYVIIS